MGAEIILIKLFKSEKPYRHTQWWQKQLLIHTPLKTDINKGDVSLHKYNQDKNEKVSQVIYNLTE